MARGGSVLDPKVVEGLVAAKRRMADSPLAHLTEREREVLEQMAQGKNNAAIARSLFLTERAVEKHINSLFHKLDLTEETDVHRRVMAVLAFLEYAPTARIRQLSAMVQRVLVATDRRRAPRVPSTGRPTWPTGSAPSWWCSRSWFPPTSRGPRPGRPRRRGLEFAAEDLRTYAEELAGERGKARVVVASDIAAAIVETAETEGVDVVVVGNLGMQDRREFLLGNVPNRVSHNARCSVIIVNTADLDGERRPKARTSAAAAAPPLVTVRNEAHAPPPVEGHLLGRAARISSVMARFGASHLFASDTGGDGRSPGAAPTDRPRGARADVRQARADPVHARGPAPAGLRRGARHAPGQVPPLTEEEVVARDGAGARRPVGGRVREHRADPDGRRDDRRGPPGHARPTASGWW